MSQTAPQPALTHRTVLAIAVPVMISNVSTPLLGLVDTGVVGQIPNPSYIGAVAVGSLIFTFVFWAFGFLRMGTTGLTAQAFGADDGAEVAATLGRALLIAIGVGALLLFLQWPIREAAFAVLDGSAEVETFARGYFDIRIWSAPATLANYALLGWFIGLGRTDIGLVLQLLLNLTNIALDLVFVLGLGWGAQGVAAGTLIAEVVAAIAGIAIALRCLRAFGGRAPLAQLLIPTKLKRMLAVNADIMIRSLALICVFVWFVANGAVQGDAILAANAVLMNFVSLAAFFLDGLAFAAEALVGRAIGAAQRAGLLAAVRITTFWAVGLAVVLTAVLLVFGPTFIDLVTVAVDVRVAARTYLSWAAFVPILGVWAFQLDGIFIGATRTADMRNAALATLAIYLVAGWLLQPFGNHGLWGALYVSYLVRAGTLLYYYPALVRSVPA
jgi:MATE family multidrug resistance protein